MSVIKQIQLEDINGSLTELADIGAKAENVEFDNSDSGLEATNIQDAIVEITESGITGLKYTVDGDNNYATIQNAIEDGTFEGEPFTKNVAIGEFSHAEGIMTTASGPASHVEGNGNQTIGPISHAEGLMTTAFGPVSHAEGENTLARGIYSHAEGNQTSARDTASHAEGNHTIAGNNASHAEGEHTLANGSCSHAEGNSTTTGNDNSHAEGMYTIAEGSNSHAEGSGGIEYGTSKITPVMAIGDSSHAEGSMTTAGGKESHAEGDGAFAEGRASHAEGYYTCAIGDYSHTQNNHTIAQGENQTVIGKFNIPQGYPTSAANTDYAFIIGNGTRTTPSNAFAVQWDGAMSQDNGNTSFKFTKDSNGNKGYIDENGNFNTFGNGSGSGDMLTSVYDPNSTVANAGGIVNYVAAHSSTDLSWITPQDYGAKGDGIADDTDAINSTIQDALTNNKCVYFPAGEYLVKWSGIKINVTSDLTIFGAGYKTSVIHIDTPYTSSDSQGFIFQNGDTTKASNLTLKDIGIVYDDNDDSIVLPVDQEKRTVQFNGFFKDIIMDNVYIHIGGSATTLPKNDCVWFQCGANKIIVKNCLIENFSNRDTGGSLWITPVDPTGTISRIIGEVQILNNEIRNTNKDEAIGIWQRSNDTDFNCRNVIIDGNKIIHDNWNGECYATNNLLTCYAKEGNVIDVNYVITNNSFITSKMNTQPIKFAGLNGVIFKDNEAIIQGRISGGNNNFLLCERGGQVLIESNLFNYFPDTYQCEFTINNNDVDFIRNTILSNRPVYFKNNIWSGSEEHVYNIANNIIHINPSYNLVIRKNAEFGNIIFTNNIVDTGLIFYGTPVGEGLILKNNKFNNGNTKTITDVKGDSLVFEYNDGIILNVSDTNITTPMDNFNYIGLSDDLQFTQNGSIIPDSNAARQAFFTVNNIIYINAINLLQLALQNSTTFDDFKALILGS